jgi:murein peptide amidase A
MCAGYLATGSCYTLPVINRGIGVIVALTVAAAELVAPAVPASAVTPVLSRTVIGHSVRGRAIVAYRLGNPHAKITALILGQMHGDEHAGIVVANSIIHGSSSVEGIDLWVIPSMNPDGDAEHTRQNAHGVDLNRNWPHNWAHLSGQYYSGPRPLSEPESRAMYRFLRTVRPRYVVSLHQPLDGVDATAGSGRAYRLFRAALARNLRLPVKDFRCWSVCHGSMSGWYQAKRVGVAVETVEFGSHPSHGYLVGAARRGIVAALHGHFGSLARHDPRLKLVVTSHRGGVELSGWAYDVDKPGTRLLMWVEERGAVLVTRRTLRPTPSLNARRRLTGRHGFTFSIAAAPGRHGYCLTAQNVRAGAGDRRVCATVVGAGES